MITHGGGRRPSLGWVVIAVVLFVGVLSFVNVVRSRQSLRESSADARAAREELSSARQQIKDVERYYKEEITKLRRDLDSRAESSAQVKRRAQADAQRISSLEGTVAELRAVSATTEQVLRDIEKVRRTEFAQLEGCKALLRQNDLPPPPPQPPAQ